MNEKLPSEDHEQMLFVQWFKRTYPSIRILSIPNGGHRHIAVATKMKATGQAKGIPDLFIPAWHLWVEMKRQTGGKISSEQCDWMSYLDGIGYRCIVGRGFEDARQQIEQIKKPAG